MPRYHITKLHEDMRVAIERKREYADMKELVDCLARGDYTQEEFIRLFTHYHDCAVMECEQAKERYNKRLRE